MSSPAMVIVQASSRSWSGGTDLCMGEVDGHPAVHWTVSRASETFPGTRIVIAAPAFDRGGMLDTVAGKHGDHVSAYYAHDASPLLRLLDVTADLRSDDYIVRADGLHLHFDPSLALSMLDEAVASGRDVVKAPDDFPVQLSCDVYRVGALREVNEGIDEESRAIYSVHPKYYMLRHPESYSAAYYEALPDYSDEHLLRCRQEAAEVYSVPREETSERRLWSGDQLGFHYELALDRVGSADRVLDIACGCGYGANLLADAAAEVVGADLDEETVQVAKRTYDRAALSFHVANVEDMPFADESFDFITSMETVEHVDGESYFREVRRVLKPGGTLMLSTPQNRLGRIPYNAAHVREYGLDEIVDLCSAHLSVSEIIGIKAGRIVFDEDPIGANTVLVARKD